MSRAFNKYILNFDGQSHKNNVQVVFNLFFLPYLNEGSQWPLQQSWRHQFLRFCTCQNFPQEDDYSPSPSDPSQPTERWLRIAIAILHTLCLAQLSLHDLCQPWNEFISWGISTKLFMCYPSAEKSLMNMECSNIISNYFLFE